MVMIYVGNMSADTDAARTRTLFERYGAIASLQMTARWLGTPIRRFWADRDGGVRSTKGYCGA